VCETQPFVRNTLGRSEKLKMGAKETQNGTLVLAPCAIRDKLPSELGGCLACVYRNRFGVDGTSGRRKLANLMTDRLGILASRLKAERNSGSGKLVCGNRSMCFAGECRSDRTSQYGCFSICFGSSLGFRPSLRRLRLSGPRPSFAGTVGGFGRIRAGGSRKRVGQTEGPRLSAHAHWEMSRRTAFGARRVFWVSCSSFGFRVAHRPVLGTCAATRGHRLRRAHVFSAITLTGSRDRLLSCDDSTESVLSCHVRQRTAEW